MRDHERARGAMSAILPRSGARTHAGRRLGHHGRTMTTPSFDRSVRAPEHVLVRELGGESLLLNLESETYFGLDDVGTRMWTLLVERPSIQHALEALQREYGVEEDVCAATSRRSSTSCSSTACSWWSMRRLSAPGVRFAR
jgi:hypothetical protein